MKKKMRLLFYDFEVFKYDWCVVIIDYNTRKKKIIINDRDELVDFYNKTKDNYIYVGFNSRSYDSVILRAIVLGLDVKEVNDKLILDGLKGFQIHKDLYKVHLYSYDTMVNRGNSLKQLEGFMGHMIKETDVDFNIDRKLTKKEMDETIYYCTHDVEETIEVFENTKSDFDAQLSLINEFDLPLKYIGKTKAQLTAEILGAEKLHGTSEEEMEYEFVNCLKLNKYRFVQEWFDENRFLTYINEKGITKKNGLKVDIGGIPTIFGWGGIHGCINKYTTDNSDDSVIVHSDVGSMYPNIMVQHNLLSRAVKEPSKYKDILEKRLELKHAGKKKEQAPFKVVLNGAFGVTIDKFSKMCDLKRGKEIPINGQLLLTDLIEQLESQLKDDISFIQFNTDAVICKLKSKDYIDKYIEICKEWENRTKLQLEHDWIRTITQANVNNYVFAFTDGTLECKGAYLQKNTPLNNDMSILNDAVRDYLVNKTPIEKTINECDELIKFQHINKIGRTYYKVLWGDKELNERVIRSFACTKDLPGLFKVKKTTNKEGIEVDSIQKVANNSEHIFIDNEDVTNKKCPTYLDKEWYINEAIKRLTKFGIKYQQA